MSCCGSSKVKIILNNNTKLKAVPHVTKPMRPSKNIVNFKKADIDKHRL